MPKMLRIDVNSLRNSVTLVCSGNLLYGLELETLRTMVQSRKEHEIRLDLAGIQKIDAAGLGVLVELQVWAREVGRKLLLAELSEPVWRLILITRLFDALSVPYSSAAIARDREDIDRPELIS